MKKTIALLLSFIFLIGQTLGYAVIRFEDEGVNLGHVISLSCEGSSIECTRVGGFVGDGIITVSEPLSSKTGDYTLTADDRTILCDSTSGNVTVTLPAVASYPNKIYDVKKTDSSSNTCILDGNASELIENAATLVIDGRNDAYTIKSDGSRWLVIGHYRYRVGSEDLGFGLDKTVNILSPTATNTHYFWKAPTDATITDVECIVDPSDSGESVVIDVQDCNGDGDSCVSVDTTITCGNTTTSDDGSLSNPFVDDDDWVRISVGTVTGTVTQASVRVKYTA